ncbi:nucleoside 2-deoxyribosyltransferase [Pararheinheimera phage vB_PsoM_KLER1-1]|nr:nucleoside 2-deoxyribosyltransferase [Pararheinheimera phage vB_PsoM_KLER1-1]
MKTIVLSGPITNVPDFKARFYTVAVQLRQAGWFVFNPAELPADMTEHQYMDICLAYVRSFDAVFMLSGAHQSVGSQVEVGLAIKCGKAVYQWEQFGELIADAVGVG